MLCSVSEWQFSSTVVKRKQQRRRDIVQWNQNGEYSSNRTNKAPTIIPWGIYCYDGVSLWKEHISPLWCEMVRLPIVEFPGNKVFCLRGSAICTVGLLCRRRVDVVKTLSLRHHCAMCPLGYSWVIDRVVCIIQTKPYLSMYADLR